MTPKSKVHCEEWPKHLKSKYIELVNWRVSCLDEIIGVSHDQNFPNYFLHNFSPG